MWFTILKPHLHQQPYWACLKMQALKKVQADILLCWAEFDQKNNMDNITKEQAVSLENILYLQKFDYRQPTGGWE